MCLLRYRNSKGYALFLALLPIIMEYKIPFVGVGASTFAIAVGLVYGGLGLIVKYRQINWKSLMPWILYYIFIISKSSVINILLGIAVIGHLMIISTDVADYDYLKKTIVNFSMLAFVLVTLQTIAHYLLHFHIPMIAFNLCLDEMKVYADLIATGMAKGSTMYRPSAFFIEPSHFAKYCIWGLGFCLFGETQEIRKAICISLGIILTTSGMGIILVAFMWFFWYVNGRGYYTISRKIQYFIFAVFGACMLYFVLNMIPFTHNIIARITGDSVDGYNAINGRLFWWNTYFGGMNWRDFMFGFGEAALPEVYFTGFMTVLYAYGIVGLALLAWALGVLYFRSSGIARILTLIYAVSLFFTNPIGFINVIYNIGTILVINSSELSKASLKGIEQQANLE